MLTPFTPPWYYTKKLRWKHDTTYHVSAIRPFTRKKKRKMFKKSDMFYTFPVVGKPDIKFPSKSKLKWCAQPMRLTYQWKNGEYQNIIYTKFKGTDNQIKVWLKAMYDFEFTSYTEKGSVKVDKDELESLGDYGKDLRRMLKLKKDISQLGGTENSLIAKFNEETHSIHGRVDTIGAATHRCTHSGPNLAQIPSGGYFRSLFTVPTGYVLVGADLANIEVRVLAHYLAEHGNREYLKAVLSKDMHWYHAKLAGFWTEDDRDWPDDDHADERTPEMKAARMASKVFFFGYLYGQGDTIRGFTLWKDGILKSYTQEEYDNAAARIQKRLNDEGLFPLKKTTYVRPTELLIFQTIYGKQVADDFLKNLNGIQDLIKDCQKQSRSKGTVTAIDGRELYSRSPHSALNLLLQGSAGVIGKQWMVNYHNLALEAGLKSPEDYYQMAYIHDEYQCAAKTEYGDTLGKCLEDGAALVGEQYSMNLPIKADYAIGASWADTH